jgi:hypothetical protein
MAINNSVENIKLIRSNENDIEVEVEVNEALIDADDVDEDTYGMDWYDGDVDDYCTDDEEEESDDGDSSSDYNPDDEDSVLSCD